LPAIRTAGPAVTEAFSTADPTQLILRSTDWAATPLGPVSQWPEALRAVLKTVLPSRAPMMLWWGPELIQLYNDAATSIIGRKHPGAAGQRAAECYREAWHELGPLAEMVLAGAGATFSRNLFLRYERHGYVEETYWNFSHSPVHDGDHVGGVLVAAMDTTRQVLAERRLGLLHRLGELSSAEAHSVRDAVAAAIATIGQDREDVPFALAHLLDDSRRTLHLAGSFGVDPGTAREWSVIPGPEDGIPSWKVTSSGRSTFVEGVRAMSGAVFEPSVLGGAVPDDAMILPLHDRTSGVVVGALALGLNPYRALDEDYRAFCRSVARQVSTALTDALAYDSQRRRAEALAQLDAAKTRFMQNVSHELRNPLTLILGSLRALREDGRGNRDDIDAADRSAMRLQRLVDSLLEFARADADQLHAMLEPTDLATVTADVASMFRAAIERAGMRLVVDIPPLSRPIEADTEMWVRILANLLANAVKFTLAGSISVRLREIEDDVVLTVADTGIGISPDELTRIFDRFHMVPGVVGRSREGAGIGLSLVADLVAAHRGSVTVQSTVGAGSAFTVRLPMGAAAVDARPVDIRTGMAAAFRAEVDAWVDRATAATAAAATAATAPEPNGHRRNGPGHVLVVEDHADMRTYLTRLLQSDGWRVTAVGNAPSALQMPAPPPDLVLSDVMLPGTDGLELVRTLRRLPETARVPIVLLTARAGTDSAAEGLAAGADDYIAKPFDPAELLVRVRVHLELSRLREYAVSHAENEAANLRAALSSNRQIGAAIGILMHRLKIGNEASFDLMREASQKLNRKLRDLADEVVRTGRLPEA
jgi:signal transduction histidine kinase/DNA-binding NarL/FixJ family response regulator